MQIRSLSIFLVLSFFGSSLAQNVISCSTYPCSGSVSLTSNAYAYLPFTATSGSSPQFKYVVSTSSVIGFKFYLVDDANFNILQNGGRFSFFTSYSTDTSSDSIIFPSNGGYGTPPRSGNFYFVIRNSGGGSGNYAYNFDIQTSSDSSCCAAQCGGSENVLAGQCVGGISQCSCRPKNSGVSAVPMLALLLISIIFAISL